MEGNSIQESLSTKGRGEGDLFEYFEIVGIVTEVNTAETGAYQRIVQKKMTTHKGSVWLHKHYFP